MFLKLEEEINKILKLPRSRWYSCFSSVLYPFVTGGIQPSANYVGVWPRDAAFILRSWLVLGEVERGIKACIRIWKYRITPSSIVVAGRSGNTFIPTVLADLRYKRRYEDLLPTTILRGCSEVYGAKPDIDSSALMITTTCMFLKKLGSKKITDELLPVLEKCAEALMKFDEDGDAILEQGPNEDWMDTAYRSGKVLYSNLCWASALKSLADVQTNGRADYWYDLYRETVKAIVKTFKLDSDNPIGVIGPRLFKYHVWQDIILAMEHIDIEGLLPRLSERLKANIGPRVVHPFLPYSNWRSRRWGYYHNGGFWPWFSSFHALALYKHGYVEEAWQMMANTLRYCIYEWVEPTRGEAKGPKPFRTGCASALYALFNFREGFN